MSSHPSSPGFRQSKPTKNSNPTRSAANLTLAYLVLAATWIVLSDHLLFTHVSDASALSRVGTYKGWFFVVVTGIGLFWLLRSKLRGQHAGGERLRSFVEHAPVALAVLDRDLRYVMTSRRWTSDFRLGDRDLAGARHYDVFPNLPQRWRDDHTRALRGEKISDELDSLTCGNGTVVWLRRAVRP